MTETQDLVGITPQPRRAKPERRRIYEAVLRARKKGARVIRSGPRAHRVTWGWSRIMTDDELLEHFPE